MDDPRLQYLISRWLDEAIEPEEFGALQTILQESASARHIYLVAMGVDVELHKLAKAGGSRFQTLDSAELADLEQAQLAERAKAFSSSLTVAPKVLAFLTVAIGLLLALWNWPGANQPKHRRLQADVSVAADDSPSLLTKITPTSGDCQWYVEGGRRTQTTPYRADDIIRVAHGKLSLHYASGVKVVLHAPSAYRLISEKDAQLFLGRLTAEVPEAGIGFTVVTPQATVIDLGTEFGIEVANDGATDVVVFKGEVDVDYNSRQTSQAKVQRLRMGEAVHLNAQGTASRIVSIAASSYSSQAPAAPPRPLVITEVRDNITRDSLFNYYEIVHAGMCEDAIAYVDREAHQYNGITEEGMPSYLVGGDYVKMFNNDRHKKDIQIRVSLAVPAKLYLLIDVRRVPSQWLRENFRNTGDLIGIDLGPFFVNNEWHNLSNPPEVGPGKGIDDLLSIWVREVPEPGVVTLGKVMEPYHLKDGSDMYGIVAVPLEGNESH